MDLKDSRTKIDDIDAEIVELLKKRFRISEEIGSKKRALNLTVEDRERDRKVLENYKAIADSDLDEVFLKELVELILRYSKRVQRK
jgi:monofunctional chorismate mutase